MDTSIWDGSASDNARNTYIDLAQKYKQKNGSLSGFLSKHGALKIGDNLHKVRLSGDRFKLANLWSYNQYQKLRSSREGYDQIRADLKKLDVSDSEIDQFIKQDKIKYKSTVSKIGPKDSKGHIKALDAGGRDGSWNIESEPKSQNFGKQAQSPSDAALMAEGTPRSTKDAFIRYKDSSGLPNPSDYTPEQRNLLRQATSSGEIDDLLASFDKQPDTPYLKNISKKSPVLGQMIKSGRLKTAQLAAIGLAAPSVLGTAASAAETGMRTQIAMQTKSLPDIVQALLSAVSLAGDFIPVVGEAVSTPADFTNGVIDQHRAGGPQHIRGRSGAKRALNAP